METPSPKTQQFLQLASVLLENFNVYPLKACQQFETKPYIKVLGHSSGALSFYKRTLAQCFWWILLTTDSSLYEYFLGVTLHSEKSKAALLHAGRWRSVAPCQWHSAPELMNGAMYKYHKCVLKSFPFFPCFQMLIQGSTSFIYNEIVHFFLKILPVCKGYVPS